MLVGFPIALWVFSFICDLIATRSTNPAFWSDMAFYTMGAGVIGALLAAVPGFIDYLGLRDYSLRRVATSHMVLNLILVVLYVFNLGLRMNSPIDGRSRGLVISAIALVLLAVSGWLGGHLVYVRGVGVQQRETEIEREERKRAA